MEKKFKPFDKVLVRVWAAIEWRAAFFSHKKDKAYYTTDGERYEGNNILPYEGNEELVGTSKEPATEVRLEEGEYCFFCSEVEQRAEMWNFDKFKSIRGESFNIYSGYNYFTYAIRFKDFDPSNMGETRKHILEVKNGKIIRYKD